MTLITRGVTSDENDVSNSDARNPFSSIDNLPLGRQDSGMFPQGADGTAQRARPAYSSEVWRAIADQSNSRTARSRPARPIAAARPGSDTSSFTRSAIPATNPSGSRGAMSPGAVSNGTSRPVSPSTTTSTMPPVAVATTAASQAIASRFTIPSGS